MTVNFGPLANSILAILGPVLTAVAAVLARAIIQRLGVQNNAALANQITEAATRGAGVAFHMLQTTVAGAGVDRVAIHNVAIATGANYVAAALPEAIKNLGVSPDTIAGMVRGELGKLLAAYTPPAISLTTPAPALPAPAATPGVV